jgi:hypothetical protein
MFAGDYPGKIEVSRMWLNLLLVSLVTNKVIPVPIIINGPLQQAVLKSIL